MQIAAIQVPSLKNLVTLPGDQPLAEKYVNANLQNKVAEKVNSLLENFKIKQPVLAYA